MAREHDIARYRRLYAGLLRLYPKSFGGRFSEGMAQTFVDLCRERRESGDGLLAFVLWTFVETSAGIIRERATFIIMQKNIIRIALATVCILLLPLVAMQFTDEVAWGTADFAVAGVLLFGAGLTFEAAARKAPNGTYRAAVGVAVATALILVWANLAVGLIGSEGNSANLMYLAVLAVVVTGAIIARLRPYGMARALFATAIAQALVPVIALIFWKPVAGSDEALLPMLGANALFVLLFVGSAMLFRRAHACGGAKPAA